MQRSYSRGTTNRCLPALEFGQIKLFIVGSNQVMNRLIEVPTTSFFQNIQHPKGLNLNYIITSSWKDAGKVTKRTNKVEVEKKALEPISRKELSLQVTKNFLAISGNDVVNLFNQIKLRHTDKSLYENLKDCSLLEELLNKSVR